MISKLPKWIADLTERSNSMMTDVQVVDTFYFSPDIKKIRFQGDLSKMNFQIGFANVIRVSDTEFRNYSASYHDTERGLLDMIIHIHGNGIGSRYIDSLKKGDHLRISNPRGKKLYEPDVKRQFIFGDETSIGLAWSLLPALKRNKNQFQFCFEMEERNNGVPLMMGFDNCLILPKNRSFADENRIDKLSFFDDPDWHQANFILTGNVKSVQTFREVIKRRTAGKILYQGYWLEGKKGL